MSSLDIVGSEFKKEWDRVGVYHAKKLIKDMPSWGEILGILNTAIRNENPKIKLQTSNDFEIIYKDLFAMKKLVYLEKNHFSQTVESDATFFFSLFFNQETFGSVISESIKDQIEELDKILKINSNYTSLKISLSDKLVPYETHAWHTCILHLAGTTDWRLKGGAHGPEKLYVLEPGDILFFKQGVEHELINETPRSSIVGRFDMEEDDE